MNNTIYETGEYLARNSTWHAEDSPWKAQQILQIIRDRGITPQTVGEVGCGAGRILVELQKHLNGCRFEGYDISRDAIELCRTDVNDCSFYCEDIFSKEHRFDVLLAIDVLEHVPDYMGFIEKCRELALYKVYHIPLDLHVSSVLRNSLVQTRESIGHLHYFSADTALATLKDTGHEIVDYRYTNGAFALFKLHPSMRRAVANVPRWVGSRISLPVTVRLAGGYSLLVLTK